MRIVQVKMFFLLGSVIIPCLAMEIRKDKQIIRQNLRKCVFCSGQFPMTQFGRIPSLSLLIVQKIVQHNDEVSWKPLKEILKQYGTHEKYASLLDTLNFFLPVYQYAFACIYFNKRRVPVVQNDQKQQESPYKDIPLVAIWEKIIQENNPQEVCCLKLPRQYRAVRLLAYIQGKPRADQWECLKSILLCWPGSQDQPLRRKWFKNIFLGVLYNRYDVGFLDKLIHVSQQMKSPYTQKFLQRALVRAAYFMHEDAVRYLCCYKFVDPRKATAQCNGLSNCIIAVTKSLVSNYTCWNDIGKRIVKLLVCHKMNVNWVPYTIDMYGNHTYLSDAAICIAAQAKQKNVVDMLLEYGAIMPLETKDDENSC